MNYPSSAESSSSPRLATRLAIVALILLVVLPIGFFSWSGELDRWRAAHAMEAWLDGEHASSIQTLTEITERLPNDHRLKLVLGEWLLEEYQAEKALELAESIPPPFQGIRSQTLMQNCLLSLGRRSEALQAYRAANPAEKSRGYQEKLFHKNALAYYQALAEVDLDLALKNSDFVIDEIAYLWNREQDIPLSIHLQGLFFTAYLYYEQMLRLPEDGEPAQKEEYAERAIATLSGAINFIEEEIGRNQSPTHERQPGSPAVLEDATSSDVPPKVKQDDPSETGQGGDSTESNQLKRLSRTLQLMLTLRALVYQFWGDQEASFIDRRRVVELGGDPESIAQAIPPVEDCMAQLSLITMFLDTRGCVNYARNDIPAALSDLNIAVMGQEALVEAAFFTPRNGRETSLDPRQQIEEFVKAPQRTLAALLFHRSWARRSAGDSEGASEDFAKIREMGYVPGNYLF